MIFHAEKSKIVNFYGYFPEYILNSANVEIVSSQKDLGLTMTHNLNMSLHISTRLYVMLHLAGLHPGET